MAEITIHLETVNPLDIFGVNNTKLNILKRAYPKLRITSRGHQLKVAGADEDIRSFRADVHAIIDHVEKHGRIDENQLEGLLQSELPLADNIPVVTDSDIIVHGTNGTTVKAKTPNQKKMVEVSGKNDVMFAIGPAGTGKTYTAVALAVKALKEKRVKRIILTRPAVEAGESLGFLPGDLKEKIDPYLRPLYDALDDMIPPERLRYYMENRIIEIAPLAFMRGRTLDKAFIILDEAQNATTPQLKMFLTRIGPSAKCIITGDLTQVDLPRSQKSGLGTALDLLSGINGIGVVRLNEKDVIRHKLVKRIIEAYNTLNDDDPNQR